MDDLEGIAEDTYSGTQFSGAGRTRTDPPAKSARIPDQPIFYPVLSEAYATKIARDWNVPTAGQGFVTRFRALKSFVDRYEAQEVGGRNRA